jgi:hypothetical protein
MERGINAAVKHQIPSSNIQRNIKLQAPNVAYTPRQLELEVSLVLGCWNLVLYDGAP